MQVRLGTRRAGALLLRALALSMGFGADARADDMSQRGVQIAAKALGFLQPAPSGDGVVAVVYADGDATARRTAETIAGYFGAGLACGGGTLRAKAVAVAALGEGEHFAAIIAVGQADGGPVMAAARAQHIACITADLAAVKAGRCTLGISTVGRVDILLNQSLASMTDIRLDAAFLLMIREI